MSFDMYSILNDSISMYPRCQGNYTYRRESYRTKNNYNNHSIVLNKCLLSIFHSLPPSPPLSILFSDKQSQISDPDLFDRKLSTSCKQAIEGVFRVGLKMGFTAWSMRGRELKESERHQYRGTTSQGMNGRSAQRMAAARISAISVEVRILQPLRALQYLISRFKSHVRNRVLVISI